MKQIFLSIVFAFISIVLTSSYPSDKTDSRRNSAGTHVLESMWKTYDEAAKADLPQKMMEISADIRKEAFGRRLAWDYYDASLKYIDAGSQHNWKIRDSLKAEVKEGFEAFGDPLLLLLYDMKMWTSVPDSLYSYIDRHSARLEKSENRSVYTGCNPFIETILLTSILNPCSESVLEHLDNDYEFALWSLLLRGWDRGKVAAKTIASLKSSFGDSYPSAQFLELFEADMIPDMYIHPDAELRAEKLKGFHEKYSDKAVSLLALQEVLQYEFDSMEDKASSSEYLAFKTVLEEFMKRRAGFRGSEADIARSCVKVDDILKGLESKSMTAEIKDGKAEFRLRNIDRIHVRVQEGETDVHEQWLYNDRNSFYAYDTLRMELPPMDDGSYTVVCTDGRKEVGKFPYEKYTLSVAIRGNRQKSVYVADYMTGQPLKVADMELMTSSGCSLCKVENVSFDGFTAIPEDICRILEEDRHDSRYLFMTHKDADGITRSSRGVYMPMYQDAAEGKGDRIRADIMTDRGAYNPGDTLEYKVVAYRPGVDMRAADEGLNVSVVLRDSRGELISEKQHALNGFGSAAGRFVLDNIERNGRHFLDVVYKGMTVGNKTVTVDEFVLPTYDLQFDEPDRLYLLGDTVTVSGVLKSFSGHSLSSATVRYSLNINREHEEGLLEIAPDGRFEIPFVATCPVGADRCDAEIRVMVTDATGETKEFFWSRSVLSSFMVSAQVLDKDEGMYSWPVGSQRDTIHDKNIVGDRLVRILCAMGSGRKSPVPDFPMEYRLLRDGQTVMAGPVMAGDTLTVDFSALSSGIYEFVLEASRKDGYGKMVTEVWRSEILRIGYKDEELPEPVDVFFRVLDGDGVKFQAGSAVKPLWAVVELVDDDGVPCHGLNGGVESGMLALNGADGNEVTLHTFNRDYCSTYPERVTAMVTGFRDARDIRWKHSWKRPLKEPPFELRISRMQDKAYPDSYCSIDVKMSPDAELLAAVFDKSTETVMDNRWFRIYPSVRIVPYANVVSGTDRGAYYPYRRMYKSASRNLAADYVTVEEESAEMASWGNVENVASVEIRDDFSTTLAFEPFIYPSESGEARLDFRTSDKLSTFVVQMFAHDKNMNNSVVRRDMLVTLPAKVSVAPPSYLYKGDGYVLHATVSNVTDLPLDGVVTVEVFDGERYESASPVQVTSRNVTVPAGGEAAAEFEINVPDSLGIKVVFAGRMEGPGVEVSDGIFVTVPVKPGSQVLSESHSAVLLPGGSMEDIVSMLRDRFVNVSHAGAEYSETVLADMLREALPSVVKPGYIDLISLSDAMYADFLTYGLLKADQEDPENLKPYLDAALAYMSQIASYSNDDGGFSWLKGMPSSAIITAAVLERLASIRDKGLLDDIPQLYGEDALDGYDDMTINALKYLDRKFFAKDSRENHYGGLSLLQYMYVRTRFVAVPFEVKADVKPASSVEVAGGSIIDKVRLIRIYMALSSSDAGKELAKAWGFRRVYRLDRQVRAEVESLLEYAVQHPDGGWYYPNAVPYVRGLLESEAYAHAMICDLLRELGEDSVADGICLWIMLQKETQEWSSDPGFLAAISSVYEASDAVKDTRIVMMRRRYMKPFDEIKATGNGMKMDIRYYKEEADGGRREVACGDTLNVGDKIVAEYSFWSLENRSFVRVSVPRPAAFRPVDQLSGNIGGWLRGRSGIYPYCYREVKSDRTVYWVDVFPEDKTVFEEELHVVHEGAFTTPAAEVECLYAPHYRANSDGGWKILVKFQEKVCSCKNYSYLCNPKRKQRVSS